MQQSANPATSHSFHSDSSIVDDLLTRQDQILEELETLNAQIEAKIAELSLARKDELESSAAESTDSGRKRAA